MNRRRWTMGALILAALSIGFLLGRDRRSGGESTASTARAEVSDYPIVPVPFTEVELTDGFWARRVATNRAVTIPFAMEQNEETGRVENFRIAGGLGEGVYSGERYNDTDVYKVLEGAAYSLRVEDDPELAAELDRVIRAIAAAQEEDGYLFTPRTATEGASERPIGIGEERFSNLAVSHELYNAGHLYEAAVAHYQSTGKRNLLDVAIANAELVLETFGEDGVRAAPGHQEIELGLVKLYRATGDSRYLEMARYFLDQRGHDLVLRKYPEGHRFAIYNDPVQIQAHLPVLEQTEAVGHAVRAMYQYSAMADVAALQRDDAYVQAMQTLWQDVVTRKLYLTGAIGARHETESFGSAFELPNATGYGETCASIGLVFWSWRLFLLHGDAQYLDVLERVLYNGLLAGVSIDGDRFFYPNPLESDGETAFNQGSATRQPWFGTACCPGNLTRFLPALPGYLYATSGDSIYVANFVPSRGSVRLGGVSITLVQRTAYPEDGRITLEVTPDSPIDATLRMRVPGWARGLPVPGDLYRDLEGPFPKGEASLRLNGEAVPLRLEHGFAVVERRWQAGDVVELELPLAVRRVVADERVVEDIGKVALERGPLVYCVEGVDVGRPAQRVVLADDAELHAERRPDLLGGLTVITGADLTAIPYYAWSHRGEGTMAVWLQRGEGR